MGCAASEVETTDGFLSALRFFLLATIIPAEAAAGSTESTPPQRYNSKYFIGSVPMVS